MLAVVMVVSIDLFEWRAPHATSNGRIKARGPAMLRSSSRNGSVGFFPLPRKAAFLAGQKSRLPPSSTMLRA
jgi:hypothetical protein